MPAFVGRAGELEALRRALVETRAGRGASVLVTGEAGIGKTRLASEIATGARGAGFEVLLGGSIDLVGTDLAFQPFIEALRPLREPRQFEQREAGSQLRAFADMLALLGERAALRPVLLVLEDLHWADASSLDLVVFLAHNLRDLRLLLLATYRPEELSSRERMRRLAEGVRRSGSALVLDLGPLAHEELTDLLAAHASAPSRPLCRAIAARAEGNPFFAEELLTAAGGQAGELPHRLRDLLLERMTRLERPTQTVLRLAAAAGREVGYPLLRATAKLPEHELRQSLRQAHEHGMLIAEQTTGSFRFRHALLAEAIYATILPGEREEIHARLADELARSATAGPAELAPHWAAAGRSKEALAASIAAARQAEAVFGLAEARAHLERALALWDMVPDAARLLQLDHAALCAWAAELASQTGTSPRAVELARAAIERVGDSDPLRAAHLYQRLARYLHESGRTDSALTASARAVELTRAQPRSTASAHALAAQATGLMLAWRFDESLPIAQQALALAQAIDAHSAELQALTDLGRDLAYIGRGDEGLANLWRALELAQDRGDHLALLRAYVSLTDVLTMLGRPAEASRLATAGVEATRRYAIDQTVLVANQIEALLAIGDWDGADSMSAAALRGISSNYPYMLLIIRADLETGRGEFDAARAHLDAASATLREDRGLGVYDAYLADLALWEHRWTDADAAITRGLAHARPRAAAQIRVQLCAKGLRAQAELAALAGARRDADAVDERLGRARTLLVMARRAAEDASTITAHAAGWLALAEAEYERAGGATQPETWSKAATSWERLQRPPIAAYCHWRHAEALAVAGTPRAATSVPLREAHAFATRTGAKPLLREIELLAQRARLDLTPPDTSSPHGTTDPHEILGLTPREAEVLSLISRGYTNREIADTLVISTKTAAVHVSHILHKLDAPNRLQAAAIAHRLTPPPTT
jgi:DNA-binding CsgD family transcriptional regulator/tetratricopeptide (TPR) repeat protein